MAVSSTSSTTSVLDVESIVSQLMSVEQKPLTRIATKEASYQSKLTAFGSLKSSLSQFQTAIKALSNISKFQTATATAANTSVASAVAGASAVPGSYSLEVSKLAQSQKLATAGQSSTTDVIGNGVISFDFGTITGGTLDSSGKYSGASFASNGSGIKTVTIDSTNNSLEGIRDAVNKANIGVTATIVNDGGTSPYRLSFSAANSGSANSMKISVANDPVASTALSDLLANDPAGTQALSETMTAQNAEFKVDGIAISKSTNAVSDVIEGVTLNLLAKNSGSPTTITVARDTASVTAAVNSFVSAYNTIASALKSTSAYNASTKVAGALNGDSSVRSIQSQLRGVLNAPVAGGASAFSLLSQVGVSMQKDGTLAVDDTKLQSALKTNFNDFAGLFAEAGKTTDSLVAYSGASTSTKAGAYAVTVTQLATKGSTQGSAAAGLNITTGSNDTLQVQLDGVTTTITLSQGNYANADALAAEIQSKINGDASFVKAGATAKVTQSGGVLTITSDRYGSASNASIVGGNGQADLQLSAGTTLAGKDVAGTINGVAATGAGQTLTGADDDDSEGLSIKITGGTTGTRGTINYSQGYAFQFNAIVDSLLDSDGLLAARTDGLNATIASLEKDKLRITDGLDAIEARYRAQYAALDVLLSNMNSTSTYLTQQLDAIANISS